MFVETCESYFMITVVAPKPLSGGDDPLASPLQFRAHDAVKSPSVQPARRTLFHRVNNLKSDGVPLCGVGDTPAKNRLNRRGHGQGAFS
jgi:hypothetical protein